jgi:hypothetical protein
MERMKPVERVLTAGLVIGPVIYLIADILYAVRGWDDPTAAIFHVFGSIGYLLVVLRVVDRSEGWMAASLLVVGAIGVAGSVAYGFNTIHVSLGDTDLVDATGAATLIKPLGLFFPLALLLCAVALRRTRPLWLVSTIGLAAVAWPVAHIANIAWLAVLLNVALVAGFGALIPSFAIPSSAPDRTPAVAA